MVERDGKVLVIRRHLDGRDYAVLPGGGVEEGETPEQAVVRELAEECTLEGEVAELLHEGDHGGRHAWYFRVTGVEGEPVLGGEEAEDQDESNQHHPMWASPKDLELMGLLPDGLTALVNQWLWPLRVGIAATPGDWQVVERLWQLYSHDLSEFRGMTPASDGCFGRGHLASYTPDGSDVVAYLAAQGDRPVGFAPRARGRAGRQGDGGVLRRAVGPPHRVGQNLRRARRSRAPGPVGDRLPGRQRRGGEVLEAPGRRGARRHDRGRATDPSQALPPARPLAHGYGARMRLELPAGVMEMRARGDDWAAWVDRLPALTQELLDEWDLTIDGALMHGYCSLVVPVVTRDGVRAVLKLHEDLDDESEFEHLALQRWHGDGTVLLLRADPRRWALLLERLHPRDLTSIGDTEACEIVAGLYPRIHVPALPQLRTITSYVERWAADLDALPADAPIPRRMREQCLSLARDLVADPASVGVIIHGDLHHHNVLAGDREPWLVIDPKPMSGDPHYEPAPMLWNRWDDIVAGNVRENLRRRFHTIVDRAGLDEDRARDWVVVRMVLNASWDVIDGDPDAEWLTKCFTIAKAVQE